MNTFNSLGSNYNLDFVIKALFSSGGKKDVSNLKTLLSEKYGGEVHLLYKGREAIEVSLNVANLPKGSCVAISGFTCYAVYKAVINAGLRVVYVDIDNTLNFSAEKLKEKLKENPDIKAVIIQNTLGYPCDIEKIDRICKEKKLILIEDLAHSAGSIYLNGKEAGIIGDFTTLSFSQDKIIDGVSGGALIIRNKKFQGKNFSTKAISASQELVDRLYPLFTYMIRNLYQIKIGKILHFLLRALGLLSKPMTYQDSGLLHGLSAWYSILVKDEFLKLNENLNHRKHIASIYAATLNKKILRNGIVGSIGNSTNLRFPIFVDKRERLIKYLKGFGIYVSDIWYDAPIAPKKYMTEVIYDKSCPVSEKISEEILNLPTHKNITEEDAKFIAEKINTWLK